MFDFAISTIINISSMIVTICACLFVVGALVSALVLVGMELLFFIKKHMKKHFNKDDVKEVNIIEEKKE